MISRIRSQSMSVRVFTAAIVVLLALATGLWWFAHLSRDTTITAYFSNAVGVYEGSDVRVLGLKVGMIDAVVPEGERVRIEMTVDQEVDIPANASAVVVAPTLVSDRYIQLAPAYTGGPSMRAGAVIPRNRTAVPVELDETVRALDELATALGPDGANSDGSVSELLDTGAANLAGNGQLIGKTLRDLAAAAETLEGSKHDLFGTVDGLAKFTKVLAKSDAQLRELSGQLSDVTGFLSEERKNLGRAMKLLAVALTDVHEFIAENRGGIQSNVDKLTDITQALVDQRAALAEVLDILPVALSNAVNAYDATSGTLQVRSELNELSSPPILMVCQVLRQASPKQVPKVLGNACDKLAPVLDGTLKLPSVEETLAAIEAGEAPPLPLPLVDSMNLMGDSGGGS